MPAGDSPLGRVPTGEDGAWVGTGGAAGIGSGRDGVVAVGPGPVPEVVRESLAHFPLTPVGDASGNSTGVASDPFGIGAANPVGAEGVWRLSAIGRRPGCGSDGDSVGTWNTTGVMASNRRTAWGVGWPAPVVAAIGGFVAGDHLHGALGGKLAS